MVEINLTSQPIDEARTLLATGAPVYLFANPVEYHGPHLSLDNDGLVSRGLASDLHEQLLKAHTDWPFLVTDDLGMGCAVVPCPGSRPTTFVREREQVLRSCAALASLGARRVVLVDGMAAACLDVFDRGAPPPLPGRLRPYRNLVSLFMHLGEDR